MKRMLSATLLILAGCQAGDHHAQTMHQRHIDAWNGRLEEYRQQYIEFDRQLRDEIDHSFQEVFANPDAQWPEVVQPTLKAAVDIREAYKIAGRDETLKRPIDFMSTMPTPGLADNWFRV